MSLRLFGYAASDNCYKVRLLLSQLGAPYERVPVDIFAGETLTDEYGAINPARETPVLQIGEDTYLHESGAILAHLAEGTPFLPEGRGERAQVLRCAQDGCMNDLEPYPDRAQLGAGRSIYG